MPRATKTGTKVRQLVVSDDLWRRVKIAAALKGQTATAFVGVALDRACRGAVERAEAVVGGDEQPN